MCCAALCSCRYAKGLAQLDTGRKISPHPSNWRCDDTGVTENLWLNLSTGHIGSGRQVCFGIQGFRVRGHSRGVGIVIPAGRPGAQPNAAMVAAGREKGGGVLAL